MAYDPYGYGGYGYDPYYDPNQGYYGEYEEPQEDTESQKLRKEQEMIESIESNRLYLRKIRRRCVQEDFADLEKTQMFLFEFLIETLEVNTKSDLGLIPESEEPSEIVAKVKFLDTPFLEIREKGEKMEGSDSIVGQTEYFETVGNAGLSDSLDPGRNLGVKESPSKSGSQEQTEEDPLSDEKPKVEYDTKWENSSGKSLLFSKTALEIIQGLDKTPVKVQISICVESIEEEGEEEEVEEEEKEEEEEEREGKEVKEVKEKKKKSTCEPLGYALIRLPDHFSLSVLQSCKSGVILPVSCIHRETCKLKNVFGGLKGELQVFVRLSCFGSVITTSFQSTGPERKYVFKPSPLPDLEGGEESEVNRETVLKPIIAEEEVAKGISTDIEKGDPFQKSVLWINNPENCGCLDLSSEPDNSTESPRPSGMPRPSDISLCREAYPFIQGNKCFCEWHNLVTYEIKNNPGGNCGCLDGEKIIESHENSIKPHKLSKVSSHYGKPSRIEKLMLKPNHKLYKKVSEKKLEPIKGLGIPPEPTDCHCNCPQIRTSLALNPMMKTTWQIK